MKVVAILLLCVCLASSTRSARDPQSLLEVGSRPATCEGLEETIAHLRELLIGDPNNRSINRQLQYNQEEYAEVCDAKVTCPVFRWQGHPFDAMIFNNFHAPSSDIEGALLVGGNFTAVGYSVGEKFAENDEYALIVGGDIDWHTGRLMKGNLVYGGQAEIGSSVLNGLVEDQKIIQQADVVTFADAEEYFLYVANWLHTFKGLTSQGSYLRGQQHTVTCETLSRLHILTIEATYWVVVNIIGEECHVSNLGIVTNVGCENTFFNFPDAETITLSEVHIPGCVSAPRANIIGASGSIDGQVVAKSWDGSTQINSCRCTGCPL